MSQTVSLLSYNIQAGIGTTRAHQYLTRAHNQLISTKAKTARLRSIGKFCAGFDIVCLQEVDLGGRRAGFENQVDIIAKASRHAHVKYQENRTVRTISRHGNAVLSSVPIQSCEDIKLPGRLGGRGALIVELDMEPQTVVACVHLSLGEADQTEQLEYLADHLNVPKFARARLIIAGDMNCTAAAAPIHAFTKMTQARAITTGPHKTYPSWRPRLGLDHILTNAPGRIGEVRVEDANYSDHLPVSAEFQRRPNS